MLSTWIWLLRLPQETEPPPLLLLYAVKDVDNKNKLDPDKGFNHSVVPKYPYGHENIPAEGDPDAKGTQVGEPVMFFPNGNINLSIDLKQYVEDTKDRNRR